MSATQPVDADRIEWDILIIGTGMGGATLGYALARAGHRVLFVEQGLDVRAAPSAGRFVEDRPDFSRLTGIERQQMLAEGGRCSVPYTYASGRKAAPLVPYVGCGVGGSSALYGMVMERLFPIDFNPRRAYADAGDSSLPEAWPIAYSDLLPYYEQAEHLYRVRGAPDPLRPLDGQGALLPPPPLSAENQHIWRELEARGAHPYPIHLACESIPGCRSCQGILCPLPCKNDAARICLTPAVEQFGARLITGCRAEFLEMEQHRVRRVHCDWLGRKIQLRARIVVLAAGALATPGLLLASKSADWPGGVANQSGLVGRNLMRHAIDLYVLRGAPRFQGHAQGKAISVSDFYFASGEKLGAVQSFGLAPPLDYLRNQPGFNPWRLMGPAAASVWRRYAMAPILASILEDLPHPENRVTAGPRPEIFYRLSAADLRRRQALRQRVKHLVSGLGGVRFGSAGEKKALGHVCGTCRFGTDSGSSVLDAWNQAHGISNLYVADTSFFPSSGGINPSLTIAANALRVAERIRAVI